MGVKHTRFVTDAGDFLLGSDGRTVSDTTVRTMALVLLTMHRGLYWAAPELGSNLFKLHTLDEAQVKFLPYCKQALEPLIADERVTEVDLGPYGVQQDPRTGWMAGHLQLLVPEGDIIDIQALPVGR